MSEVRPTSPQPAWNPWPVSIVAFFAMAILGFAAFIWFCTRHPADLVAGDYYEQELRYQGRIDRMQNAQRDAAGAAVSYEAATRSILIALPSGSVKPGGVVELYRPSSPKLDRRLGLELDADGRQRIDAAALSPGLWKVRVSWTSGDQEYWIDRKVVIAAS